MRRIGDEKNAAGAIARFELDGGLMLSLYPRKELAKDANVAALPSKTGEFSIGHLVSSKENVDAMLARAKAAGATDIFWEIVWNPD